MPTNRSAKEFARGDRTGVLITRVPFPAKTSSNAVVNLLSRSRIRNLNLLGPLAEVHQEVAGLLGGPGSGRMGGDAQDVHGPGLDLHHEQDVQALEQHGVDVQEVARQDAGRLGGQELPPGRRRPPRRGAEPGGGQDPADRPLPHPVPQAEQLALDAPVAPARVLPRQLLHQRAHLGPGPAAVPARSDRSISC